MVLVTLVSCGLVSHMIPWKGNRELNSYGKVREIAGKSEEFPAQFSF